MVWPSDLFYLLVELIRYHDTVKAYIRKSSILFAMRDYTKAIEVAQEATIRDTEHKHTSEIAAQEMKCQQALYTQRGEESQEETLERAMRDPEVAVSFLFLVKCSFVALLIIS